ncbi:hypothetical protein QPI28_004455 [Vibrio parahaemolyticus]|nr:hypothetical protein [Vibrio parahaemolyticus]NVJ56663.1 hypothetical protein [Vibrionaceae bacterium]ELA7176852.1 hypothetical protein [Vibrio parahaemolyticus]ELA7459341.1 hypothetical protein [Vibrio parahaemolyticus]ELA7483304.1 hypothetical protein [Vibrio parahaemolyticus]
MSEHTTIIVKWRGPYGYDEIIDRPDLENGLYLATGKLKYEREAMIQYCGITEGSYATRFKYHHKIHEITRDQEFWLGEVTYPEDASRYFMEMAESIIVCFWQPTLNDRKKLYLPKPTTIINQWFKKNNEPRYRQHSLCKDLDDVISWDGEVWRSGNLSVYED